MFVLAVPSETCGNMFSSQLLPYMKQSAALWSPWVSPPQTPALLPLHPLVTLGSLGFRQTLGSSSATSPPIYGSRPAGLFVVPSFVTMLVYVLPPMFCPILEPGGFQLLFVYPGHNEAILVTMRPYQFHCAIYHDYL